MQKHRMIERYEGIFFQSRSILKNCSLCDICLGRFFIRRAGTSSVTRLGSKIKNVINFKTATECYICKNLFANLDFHVKLMQNTSAGYEFSSFLVGCILKHSIVERDDKIRSKFYLRGVDSIKTEITRELGKRFARKTKTKLDHLLPDITFTMNFRTGKCEVRTRPLFLYGRYLKKKRGLSQKHGQCKDCKGKGCIFCNNHGIVSFNSIEGKISKFLYEKFETDHVKFTWIGGEDKTSLVLGNGRPFFVKIMSPKKRNIRLSKKTNFNEITIQELRMIDHIPIGSIPFRSKIKLSIATKNAISSKKLKKLKHIPTTPIIFNDINGKQFKKTIHKLNYKKTSFQSFTAEIEADGGLPIKRFIEGFDVVSSISKILNTQCFCQKFDIKQITLSK